MRASTDTLLSLAEWGECLGVNPWELAQIGAGFPRPNDAQCNFVFFQQPWQRAFLSREEVARAIDHAEEVISLYLGYWPAPKYIVDEVTRFPYQIGSTALSHRYPRYSLTKGKFIQAGIKKYVPILGNVPLILSDRDGDGVNDTFTLSAATTVTDPDEIHVYYALTDRFNENIRSQWEVRPINVSITLGTVTITGHSSLLVKPALTEITDPDILDVTDPTIYVSVLDIYQETTDTTVSATVAYQGRFVWDTPYIADQPIYVRSSNPEVGEVRWHLYNECIDRHIPATIRTNYVSGVPRFNNRMDKHMADIVARLSVIYLPEVACGCERTNYIMNFWKGLPSDQSDRRPLTIKEIDENPFGPQNGARYAWDRIKLILQMRGVSVP